MERVCFSPLSLSLSPCASLPKVANNQAARIETGERLPVSFACHLAAGEPFRLCFGPGVLLILPASDGGGGDVV